MGQRRRQIDAAPDQPLGKAAPQIMRFLCTVGSCASHALTDSAVATSGGGAFVRRA